MNKIIFNKKRLFFVFLVFSIFTVLQAIHAQSRIFLNPGFFYNGAGFTEDVKGFGLVAGVEYMQSKDHIFSIELRTKYGYYAFDDGTKWRTDNDRVSLPPKNPGEARLEYNLFSPQIGLVPKLHFYFDESLSFFLENEVVVGLMIGNFKYKGFDKKKKITESIFSYNIGIGAEYKFEKWILGGSIAYSTLNFRGKIREHQPVGYQDGIPDQNAIWLISILFKVPLYKK